MPDKDWADHDSFLFTLTCHPRDGAPHVPDWDNRPLSALVAARDALLAWADEAHGFLHCFEHIVLEARLLRPSAHDRAAAHASGPK